MQVQPMRRGAALLLALAGLAAGCAGAPPNPSFALTVRQARQALDLMAVNPMPLARPVLILGGYLDPGYGTNYLNTQLNRVVSDARITTVTFVDCGSFEECRRRLIEKVEQQFPDSDPLKTVPVDAVAASMGGLVARYAAEADAPAKRLRLVRLFTVATPYRGAMLADILAVGGLAAQMRSDSTFLHQLNRPSHAGGYRIIPYVWTNDNVVGAANAAPPGATPWWLPPIALSNPHLGAMQDPRIAADIARRLRGEKPYTIEPPAPLPPGATGIGT